MAAVCMLFAGAVVAAGAVVWSLTVAREPSDHFFLRLTCAGIAVALTGSAAKTFFWDAPQNRRPGWKRASAVLTLLGAAYMAVLAIRGP